MSNYFNTGSKRRPVLTEERRFTKTSKPVKITAEEKEALVYVYFKLKECRQHLAPIINALSLVEDQNLKTVVIEFNERFETLMNLIDQVAKSEQW